MDFKYLHANLVLIEDEKLNKRPDLEKMCSFPDRKEAEEERERQSYKGQVLIFKRNVIF